MRPWPERVYCDTSFFFACLEARDVNHAQALKWLELSQSAQTVFWATWDIVGETITLLRRKSGYRKADEFIRQVVPALSLASCDDSIRLETLEVFQRFAKDKKLSFCDCLSYVVLTTLLDCPPTATFDAHFKMLGLPVLE
jgi:predicted nucleic acid-binding protein